VTAPALELAPAEVTVDRDAYLYDLTIRHVRSTPLRNTFTYRSYQWLVDLDALPRLALPLRPFARIETRDHCCEPQDDPTLPLRAMLDKYLQRHGIDLRGGAIRMLASARVLGYVFNPLTVYWCHDDTGTLACVIAEVRNTYGGSHRYLLRTDERGRAQTDKQFYVSPFFEVAGRYSMSLPEPAEALELRITLHPPQGAPFVASVSGTRQPAHGTALLRRLLGRPAATISVSALIRWQGIKLYLRGLAVVPRPHAAKEKS
jgi:DUF1365 family protein